MLPTIFAQATPAGKSALCVLRIAGPQSLDILKKMAPYKTQSAFIPRQASVTKLYDQQRKLLDEALVLFFKGPHSYTGEDLVEMYLHGSPVVSRAVQNAILATNLARFAEPGEFTRRAFENNRMDLTQVEGIRDLLAAETEMQRISAVGGAAGQLSRVFEDWRSDLVNANALLTAAVDFAEDNGLSSSEFSRARQDVERVRSSISTAVKHSSTCAEIVQSGLRVALLGEPNAGKSSLTNYLLSRQACLVSEIPGTTRDVLEVNLEVQGHKLRLFDTAGIRNSTDFVEKLGIERAREVIDSAHAVVALFPATDTPDPQIVKQVETLRQRGKLVLVVTSKSDLANNNNNKNSNNNNNINNMYIDALAVSIKTGAGIEQLLNWLALQADRELHLDAQQEIDQTGMSGRARNLLETEALPGLDQCLAMLDSGDVVLANAELARATQAIGMVTGRDISVHEVLDVVFGEFCIGK